MIPHGPDTHRAASVGPYLTLGIELAVTTVAFFFAGRWLDAQWNTSPWMMIAGIVVGTVGGFIHFFKTVTAIDKKEQQNNAPHE